MIPFHEAMSEYRSQMEHGVIRQAYRGLMEYMMDLRVHFERSYPDYVVSGSIYPGYMDMTYFSCTPESLHLQKLKIAIVFLHETCRFEVWLAGMNKRVQAEYWNRLMESNWSAYPLAAQLQGVDAITTHVLSEHPDFRDLPVLTRLIEQGVLQFIADIEEFLSKEQP
ncbi:MAG: hypothetical protein BWY93_00748 [Euryarchaeota archaeon ADurb.BinA087]|nr:MAG: hypothetical protein BWY93_00748 [Euryarchaeota archaeon ADurb.BinA087]HNQ25462.1 hypothetical protein [Methanoregulaceae archaeon]HPX73325.1 hypothetical protein [Methanoregulaceae archaeon]HQA79161.1 hypothetical protein [Methanoregulaceae archaeon]